jgi:hypothetical protein
MRRLAVGLGVVAVGLLSVGCGEDTNTGNTGGSAGTAIAGSGGGQTGGAGPSTGGSNAGGTAGTGVGGGNAGTGGGAAGEAATGGAAGTPVRPVPGPECIAPCIWELMEPCRPTAPCTRSAVDVLPIHFCFGDGASLSMSLDELRAYTPDGSLCYSVDYTDAGEVWHDSTGTEVATLTRDEQDGSQTVVCGGNQYHVDLNTPECQAALDGPECESGECTAGRP